MDTTSYTDVAIQDCIGLLSLEFPWMKEKRIEAISRKIVEDVLQLAFEDAALESWVEYENQPTSVYTRSRIEAAEKDILNLKKTILDLAGRLDNVSKYARVPLDHHATSSHFNERYNGLANPWHDYGKKS
jgi:hypothetical protein